MAGVVPYALLQAGARGASLSHRRLDLAAGDGGQVGEKLEGSDDFGFLIEAWHPRPARKIASGIFHPSQ
jgi:hypothetical protein